MQEAFQHTISKAFNKVIVSACPFLSAFSNYQYTRKKFTEVFINLLENNNYYFKERNTPNVTQPGILFVTSTAIIFHCALH
jgi:hypothetical protein